LARFGSQPIPLHAEVTLAVTARNVDFYKTADLGDEVQVSLLKNEHGWP